MALSGNVTTQDTTNQSNLLVRTGMVAKAATTIYQGAIVANDAGDAAIPDGTLQVVGIALNYAAAGEAVRIGYNHVVEFTLAGVVDTDNGKTVYASSDNVITLTPTAGPSPLGQIHKVTGTNTCQVRVTCQAAPKTYA